MGELVSDLGYQQKTGVYRLFALSSTEAEIMAASLAGAEILYLRGVLRDLGYDVTAPTVLWVDNSGAVELTK